MKRKRLYLIIVGLILITLGTGVTSYSHFLRYQKRKEAFAVLKERIKQYTSKDKDNFSLIIKDLTFNKLTLAERENKEIVAASLIKLPLLAVALKAVAEGKLSLDREETFKRSDIAQGSGAIKKMKLPLRLSLREVLKFMIAYSDNTATNRVIDHLGFDYINRGFNGLNLRGTVLKRKMMDFAARSKGRDNYTTASDIASLLERIYHKQLINSEFSQFALSLLRQQTVNDRISRYLPEEVNAAHKTGLEKGVVHDAGIIFTTKGNYLLCVLTENIKDYRKAKKFIAYLSLLTYNYYQ